MQKLKSKLIRFAVKPPYMVNLFSTYAYCLRFYAPKTPMQQLNAPFLTPF